MVSLINSRVKSTMIYAEVHPKYNDYGEFPREFERGRRVEEFLAMDGKESHLAPLSPAFTLTDLLHSHDY